MSKPNLPPGHQKGRLDQSMKPAGGSHFSCGSSRARACPPFRCRVLFRPCDVGAGVFCGGGVGIVFDNDVIETQGLVVSA